MKQNKFGEMVFSETDVCDLLMQGHDLFSFDQISIDHTVDLDKIKNVMSDLPNFKMCAEDQTSPQQWHKAQQSNWHMPDEFKNLDIAEHVLSLCDTQEELQRCGQELLLFQERELFDLLKYLAYLVAVMKSNGIIWGVGRGSSVASYVLYKLGVHRINSMYYDLDPLEFLR